jgi:hypothetical protein
MEIARARPATSAGATLVQNRNSQPPPAATEPFLFHFPHLSIDPRGLPGSAVARLADQD